MLTAAYWRTDETHPAGKSMHYYIVVIVIALLMLAIYRYHGDRRREQFIRAYPFPPSIKDKLRTRYPHLDDTQLSKVIRGLRDYFSICNSAGSRMVSMPSQVVDVAWHEFILFTRNYAQFCQRGLGRFLHHVPAEAMTTPTLAQTGIKRAWRLACKREGLDPANASRIPLLFALDQELNIPDGFRYVANCRGADGRTCGCGGNGCSSCSSGCGGD